MEHLGAFASLYFEQENVAIFHRKRIASGRKQIGERSSFNQVIEKCLDLTPDTWV